MRADTTVTNILTVACSALLLSGCSGKAELVKYNDRIARIFRELEPTDRGFFETGYAFAAGKDRKGKPVPLHRFRTAYDRLQDAVMQAKKEAATLSVPHVDSARKFHDSFLQVIKAHELTVEKFAPVREAPENKLRADRERLRSWLDEAYVRRGRAWAELDQAQEAFAKENGIKLK